MLKRLIYGLIAIVAFSYCTPALSQTSVDSKQNDEIDPYVLCEKFPLNSVCQPYHLNPIPLEGRPGEEAFACVLKLGEAELKGPCKYVVESDQYTVYIEEGQKLEGLDNQKPTRVVSVSMSNIIKLLYGEDTFSRQNPLSNILPLRLITGLFSQPTELSLISVVFPKQPATTQQEALSLGDLTADQRQRSQEALSSGDLTADQQQRLQEALSSGDLTADQQQALQETLSSGDLSATQQQPTPNVLTLVVKQEEGAAVRSQLETLTGLPSEAPPPRN